GRSRRAWKATRSRRRSARSTCRPTTSAPSPARSTSSFRGSAGPAGPRSRRRGTAGSSSTTSSATALGRRSGGWRAGSRSAPAPPLPAAALGRPPVRYGQSGTDPEGTYPTKDGVAVHVVFPGLSAPDAVAGQSTADFLGALLHGPELATVTVELGAFATVQEA